jgi:hypothetical protein
MRRQPWRSAAGRRLRGRTDRPAEAGVQGVSASPAGRLSLPGRASIRPKQRLAVSTTDGSPLDPSDKNMIREKGNSS